MNNTERIPGVETVVIGGTCLLAFACNLLLPGLFWQATQHDWIHYFAFASIGALVSEVALLAIWCGLGQQPLKYRLPITITLLLFAACSYCVGLQLPESDSRMPWQVAVVLSAAAAGMFAAMQLPLWLIRRTSQSEIALSKVDRFAVSQQNQFGVGYLMILTSLFAVVLVVIQKSMPQEGETLPLRDTLRALVYLTLYIVFSCLLCIPCVWIAMSKRNKILSLVTLAATITVAPFLLFGLTKLINSRVDADAILLIFCYELGLTGTTLATLFLFRLLGYQVFNDDPNGNDPNGNDPNGNDPDRSDHNDGFDGLDAL